MRIWRLLCLEVNLDWVGWYYEWVFYRLLFWYDLLIRLMLICELEGFIVWFFEVENMDVMGSVVV